MFFSRTKNKISYGPTLKALLFAGMLFKIAKWFLKDRFKKGMKGKKGNSKKKVKGKK